jgi:hypothetical protein
MVQLTPQRRVLLAREPTDFPRGIEGLAALCRQRLGEDPMAGAIFVFRNRPGTSLKLLSWTEPLRGEGLRGRIRRRWIDQIEGYVDRTRHDRWRPPPHWVVRISQEGLPPVALRNRSQGNLFRPTTKSAKSPADKRTPPRAIRRTALRCC